MTVGALVVGTGGVWDLGTIRVTKSYARVTPLLWIGMAVWMLTSSWGGKGVWVRVLPVFFFLWRCKQSVGAGSAIVTPRSAGVKGGMELL